MTAATSPWPAPRRAWRRALALCGMLLLLALAVGLLADGLGRIGPLPVHLVLDGQAVDPPWILAGTSGLDIGQRLLLAASLLLLALVLLVAVPLLLLGGLALLALLVGGVLLATVGAPLLVVAGVLALLLSPLILLLLLLRWLLR